MAAPLPARKLELPASGRSSKQECSLIPSVFQRLFQGGGLFLIPLPGVLNGTVHQTPAFVVVVQDALQAVGKFGRRFRHDEGAVAPSSTPSAANGVETSARPKPSASTTLILRPVPS